LAGFGEAGHEALEAGAELVRVERAEQPAERVVTGRAVLELQEAVQEVDLARGEFGHVAAVLAARQHRAKRNDQHLQQIVPGRIAGARLARIRKTGQKTTHGLSPLSFDGG